MLNTALQNEALRLLPRVKTPAQYMGGEVNSTPKDHARVRGKLCLCFPDAYTIGMSHHGLQVLYTIMNADPQWACERAFAPWMDWEAVMRGHKLPLYGLENFTPLHQFDVVGFSLQYEVCYTNVLNMLDLGGIPHFSDERLVSDPLVIAGGPGAQNPELLAPFVDLFVIGDGEQSLPWVMNKWIELKEQAIRDGDNTHRRRLDMLAEVVGGVTWAYAPAFYTFDYMPDGTIASVTRTRSDVPAEITSCAIDCDFDRIPLPTKPVVPFVQTPHDRIAIEIMRGCPHQCRFCQSTTIKRMRFRTVENIVNSALESYRNTGTNEISLLSLSTSDYPHFEQLVKRMHEVFHPLGVNVSLPSLRINHQLRTLPELMQGVRKAGLTLAPEVARDDMREQIRKKIKNDDLYEGCREAFKHGWQKVKLYFLCGLPGERREDLDGIVEMAETIARISRDVTGRYKDVTASVSNFVPKPHTPYQWNGMQTRDYFRWAGDYLHRRKTIKGVVKIKQHDIETSLLEGILTRGDRRVSPALYEAWKRGARMDGWKECFNPHLWWKVFDDLGIDVGFYSHRERPMGERLPWDHVNVKKGRAYLEKEQERSVIQLKVMAEAVAGDDGPGCGG